MKLKSCPFCGGHAAPFVTSYGWGKKSYGVECTICKISLKPFDTDVMSFEAWNTRHNLHWIITIQNWFNEITGKELSLLAAMDLNEKLAALEEIK